MSTQTIRSLYLQYFKDRQHLIVPSSPVIPHDDPTLLFINAGMNQFKDVFLGKSHRDYQRAACSQKCIRVGGKHNDLENVGHTRRHLTFFEMLGNFSFGDYFKEQAIQYAWEVSTSIFGFDPLNIWPTVFREDDEAFDIWAEYVPTERITRMDEKDNFWVMGETGPCGPCSELYFDRGPQYGEGRNPKEDLNGDRFLEFWNLVFMQYNTLPSGEREPLPKPSIDTGSGLERVLTLQMGADSVFETDLLRSLIARIERISGIPYHIGDSHAPAFRVIADHLRCLAFAIADGAQPSNVDQGYVLRKVLRRAVRYGRSLGIERPFLADILPELVSKMGSDYPELGKGQERIAEILISEEEGFIRTLRRGGNMLHHIIENAQATHHTITGEDAFKLKDTYGFPLEEILLIAKDSKLNVDEDRYRLFEQEAKERSRGAQKQIHQVAAESMFAEFLQKQGETKFLGYTQFAAPTRVIALVVNDAFVQQMEEGEEGLVFLAETPFYAQMGGQVGDTGHLEGTPPLRFEVHDCVVPYKGLTAHRGRVQHGSLHVEDRVVATIDGDRRQKIANNHTATHLLHWALHSVLGEHVKQAGSIVDAERLRFDFRHHKALTLGEIRKIEDLVNAKIRENVPVKWYVMPYEEVQKRDDIKQFFGEKYGSLVRVVDIDYSKELCGGTHCSAVGNIGLFRIAKEGSIAAGIRRIEAVSGSSAEELSRQQEDTLLKAAQCLKAPPYQLQERLKKLVEEHHQCLQQLENLRSNELHAFIQSLLKQCEQVKNVRFLIAEVSLPADKLRQCVDLTLEHLGSGIVLLGTPLDAKCKLIAKVSDDCVKQGYSAHEIIKLTLPLIEGSGGGKPHIAQGGGKAPKKLLEAFAKVRESLHTIACKGSDHH